jgi:GNAT superfamily N-acetyltransferase
MTTATINPIRPVRTPEDAPALAALFNQSRPEPMTAEDLIDGWSKTSPDGIRHRLAAVDETGAVVGSGGAAHDPWDQPERWNVGARVDLAARGRGLGSVLLTKVETFARSQGATVLEAECRDSDPAILAWAERRGYRQVRHLFESTLDLATFDESRFAGSSQQVEEAAGIRIRTLADVAGEKEAYQHRIYELVSRTVFDIPGVTLAWFPPFDEWAKWALNEAETPPDCHIFAADGERVVGVTALERIKTTGAMYTAHTSVDPGYRGKGIALALKLASIAVARQHGAPYMRTNNDALNAPMLAVNRKLGYVPTPGIYRLEKNLA